MTQRDDTSLSGIGTYTIVYASQAREQAHEHENEDCLLVDQHGPLVGVFDGVGGRGNGHFASHIAAQTIQDQWQQRAGVLHGAEPASPQALLQDLLQQAHQHIQQASSEHPEKHPATTAALAVFPLTGNGATLTYAHVGDSRMYLLREQQVLQRLTEDEGYFSLLLRKGRFHQDEVSCIEQATEGTALSEEDLQHFSKRNKITNALGWEEFQVAQTGTIDLVFGDRIVLCSDGIHDNLTNQEMEALLRKEPFAANAQRLVQAAAQRARQEHRRAKQDDMSAVVVAYQCIITI